MGFLNKIKAKLEDFLLVCSGGRMKSMIVCKWSLNSGPNVNSQQYINVEEISGKTNGKSKQDSLYNQLQWVRRNNKCIHTLKKKGNLIIIVERKNK